MEKRKVYSLNRALVTVGTRRSILKRVTLDHTTQCSKVRIRGVLCS